MGKLFTIKQKLMKVAMGRGQIFLSRVRLDHFFMLGWGWFGSAISGSGKFSLEIQRFSIFLPSGQKIPGSEPGSIG